MPAHYSPKKMETPLFSNTTLQNRTIFMIWIKYVICFIVEFSAARICGLSLDKRIIHFKFSRSVVMKRTDRRAIGTECLHRRSRCLHGTACSALPDENRVNVTAVPRPNMSTAAFERRPGQHAQGSIPISHIWPISHILHTAHIKISDRALLRG